MTRVHERHVSAAPSAADRHRRVDQKKRKASYKVILEEVADKQKKLKTVVRRSAWAPIPALSSDTPNSYIRNRKPPEAILSFLLEILN